MRSKIVKKFGNSVLLTMTLDVFYSVVAAIFARMTTGMTTTLVTHCSINTKVTH